MTTPRQPLKRVSKKRAALNRSYAKWRDEYLEKHSGMCVIYGNALALELHHICRGGSRKVALMEACAVVPVSYAGHRVIEGWEVAKQLACKFTASREQAAEIDLERFNELRGRASTAVEWADVACYLQLKGNNDANA